MGSRARSQPKRSNRNQGGNKQARKPAPRIRDAAKADELILPSDPLGAAKRRAARQGWAKWIVTPGDEKALLNGCWFDLERAEIVERFFAEFLRHSKGDFAGQPFVLLDWQRDQLFYPLFGWARQNERGKFVRRFTKAYVEIPKKNGKSTIASGVGLYMLCGDGEDGAEIYSSATDRNQANIVHREAVNMVEQSPELADALVVNRSTWNISYPECRSFYRALGSVPSRNEGFNAHCILADELHEWRGAQGRALYDAIKWAFAARSQPLFFQITTSGEDMTSVCKEQHDYALSMLSGLHFDDRFFPLVYAAGPEDEPWSEETWRKANPSLGDTITVESFASDAHEAKKTPTSQARFKRYRLNIWTTGDSPWLRPEDWAACKESFSAEELQGRSCYAAWDLSRTRDSTSCVLMFPDEDDDIVRILPHFWLPSDQAALLRGVVPWEIWAEQGFVTLIEGGTIEFSVLEDAFDGFAQQFDILAMAFDPWNAEDTTLRMETETGVPRIAFGQSIKNFAAPTDEFERRVLNRTIRHNGHPVMAWQVGNAVISTDPNNNKRPKKAKPNDPRKVDGVVAGIMSLALYLQNVGNSGSYYDDHDLEIG